MNEISVIDGKRVWIYQRDSLGNNSAKLEEQKQKMLELAEHHGFEVVGCTTEIASGNKKAKNVSLTKEEGHHGQR